MSVGATIALIAVLVPGGVAFAEDVPSPELTEMTPVPGESAAVLESAPEPESSTSVPVPDGTGLAPQHIDVTLAAPLEDAPTPEETESAPAPSTTPDQTVTPEPTDPETTPTPGETEPAPTPEDNTPTPEPTSPAESGTGIDPVSFVQSTPRDEPSVEAEPVAIPVGEWVPVGDTGITIAAAQGAPATAARGATLVPVAQVAIDVLDQEAAAKHGLDGLVLKITRDDDVDAAQPVALQIPDDLMSQYYGADFAGRARWIQIPETATAAKSGAVEADDVATESQPETASTMLTPLVSSSAMLITAAASTVSATGTGSFSATDLKASSTWDVSAQTGGFSWSFPMRTPPAAAGPSPSLALNYDSQSVDGLTSSTNNQPSAIGEGWTLGGGGFIERSYVACSKDTGAVASSGDLCWKTDNATINLAGHSGLLVRDATTGVWKLQHDDGSRIERITGTGTGKCTNGARDNECWKLTTTDGTQYFFGMNRLPGWSTGKPTTNSTWTVPVFGNNAGEPCYDADFANASCMQGWRWNLDYIVDTHGNAETLHYTAETNNYAKNGNTATTYTRGGQLEHIEYGLTKDVLYTASAASSKVIFGYDNYGRCNDTTRANCTIETITNPATTPAHPTAYPDVPFDQLCTSGSCTGKVSPSFWTTGMLNTVTTQTKLSGSYSTVDVWTLGHSFPDPGDTTNAALWLTKVGHTGYSGSASTSEPDTIFTGVMKQNRVWVKDGLLPLDKARISSIRLSTGATISVNYSAPECTKDSAPGILASPQTNTSRCFPQWWSAPLTATTWMPAQQDLFHKYVVTSVISDPVTGGPNDLAQYTGYEYTGTPAWRYDISPLTPDGYRSWSDYAGYNKVEIRTGDPNSPSTQQTTAYTFYQGMDGDQASYAGGTKSVSVTVPGQPTVADSRWFAGLTRDTRTLDGTGAVVREVLNSPWASAITASDGTNTAWMSGNGTSVTTEPLSTGGNRTTTTTTTYDTTYGYPLTESTATSDAGSTCTKTDYAAPNTTSWLIGLPKEVLKVGVACPNLASASYPADAISQTRTNYDSLNWGVAPSKGDATTTQTAISYNAGVPVFGVATSSYDSMGRVIATTDMAGHTISSAYTPSATAAAGSGSLTKLIVTNTLPFSWTTTTVYNPAWGVETSVTDENGKITTAKYDSLGRRTGVWLPDRPAASNTTPSIGYTYTVSQTAPLAVATTRLAPTGTLTDYTLYDGLGRQVQTQSSAESGGTAVTDTGYDNAGRVSLSNAAYWTVSVNPSAAQFEPASQQNIASRTLTTYDRLGRTTATILQSYAVERYRTTYAYVGADRVDMTPPAGGTPTSTYTNSLGQETKLVQYAAATPLSTATKYTTTYAYNPQGKMKQMVGADNATWTWKYDVLGQQTEAKDPDSGTTTSTYDIAGNLTSTTDGRGVLLSYTYDELNRKTGQYRDGSGSAGLLLASWKYDTLAKNQLTSSSSYTGSTLGTPGLEYKQAVTGYDDGYRPTGSVLSIPTGAPGGFGGTSYTTGYTYNPDGSPLTKVEPAAGGLNPETITYGYGALGRPTTQVGLSTVVYNTYYYPTGLMQEYTRSGTTVFTSGYGYDFATNDIIQIRDTATFGGVTTEIANRQYTRDNAGNITSAKTTGSTTTDTQCYTYDYLRALTAAWTPASNSCATAPTSTTLGGPAKYWTTYAVNPANGNRTQVINKPTASGGATTTSTYTYGATQPHAVSSINTITGGTTNTSSYGYDASGSTTTRPGQTLSYGPTNKIQKITTTPGGAEQTNVYDADGNLLLQTDPTTGTTLFAGDTEYIRAPGATAASAVRTYTHNGIPIAERTTTVGVANSKVRWLATDINKTVDIQVVSSDGTINRRYTDPYGNSRGTIPPWGSNHTYLNAPKSTFSGLVQLGARAYDSTIGKFLSVDAVLAPFNPQQNNGYAYGGNNPATFPDPSGNCFTIDDYHCAMPQPGKVEETPTTQPPNGPGSDSPSQPATCVGMNLSSCSPGAGGTLGDGTNDTKGGMGAVDLPYQASFLHGASKALEVAATMAVICAMEGPAAMICGPSAAGMGVSAKLAGAQAEAMEVLIAARLAQAAAAKAGIMDATSVRATLATLPIGKTVPVVADDAALGTLFSDLTMGGTNVANRTVGNYTLNQYKLPDSTAVQMRSGSASGGRTIDITFPDGSTQKVHIQ
ncbi:RHS repeat-associated core domain-containing protein [Herbiconiux sp. P16]|uniref:RHS repeat domain-containing protein n=1 Tax=Herbiconiux wuyangfengii TaxID=3342794 RepID=UPI0035BC6F12